MDFFVLTEKIIENFKLIKFYFLNLWSVLFFGYINFKIL